MDTTRVQIIRGADGEPLFAVLPIEDYLALAGGSPAEEARPAPAEPERPPPPAEVAARLAAGENPILVWREHRGVTREVLAGWIGFDEDDVAAFESGELVPTLEICQLIAHVLDVALDDVIPV